MKYGDRVIITGDEFFQGLTGKVIDYRDTTGVSDCSVYRCREYLVDLDSSNVPRFFVEDQLKKIED